MAKKGRESELADLKELTKPKAAESLRNVKQQLRTAAKVAAIAFVVIWLLALGFASGLDSRVPLYVALVLTISGLGAAFMIRRNVAKSESIGSLLAGEELTDEQRAARMKQLDAQADKGDAGALLAKAQLVMQDRPEEALGILERVDLEKAPKLIALQVRGVRAMLHLSLGDVAAARKLADEIDLSKAPDTKTRGNFAAVVAEAWARSGNPIEAAELLSKYDPNEKELEDVRLQLYRARAFVAAHKQDLKGIKSALKSLSQLSPQLVAMFVAQKRVHPLLQKEAKKALEKSGLMPRAQMRFERR
ncbi:MAG: hypothetical protein HYV07_01255 [Deltaproteobacteria bacterium]|nr:hypothetical protein [Deltaproteobacteria bacterium]